MGLQHLIAKSGSGMLGPLLMEFDPNSAILHFSDWYIDLYSFVRLDGFLPNMAENYHDSIGNAYSNEGVEDDLSRFCRMLRSAWVAPIDSLQRVTDQRCGGQYRFTTLAGRPDALSGLEAFQIERHSDPIMPQNLDGIALVPKEAKYLLGMLITPRPC